MTVHHRSRADRRIGNLLLALLAAASLSSVARAEPLSVNPASPSALMRRAWTTGDGLPQDTVLSIAQTRDGYLWLGTGEGLARFDGVRFVVYDRRTTPGWGSYDVEALAASADGGLWVGLTDGGLLRFRDGKFMAMQIPSPTVRALYEARDGTLWVGMDRGVARLPAETRRAEAPEGLLQTYVYAFNEDADGRVWLGTSAGLYVYQQGHYRPVGAVLGLPPDPVVALAPAQGGGMWVGVLRGGVYFLDGDRAEFVGLRDERIAKLLEAHDGTLWVTTDSGLWRRRNGTFEATAMDPRPLIRVGPLFADREHSMWVGTWYSGLLRFTAARVAAVGAQLEFPPALTVLEDLAGTIWFGTAGRGLGRLQGETLTTLEARDGLASSIIGPLLVDHAGALWFGPRAGNLLYKLERGVLSSRALRGIPASLYQDDAGALWVGTTDRGLYRLASDRVTQWTPADGLPSRAVRSMTGDGAGGLWLGTPRGLVHFREGPEVVYTTADGMPSNRVAALYRDPAGPLWVGLFQGGLVRFDRGRFTAYGPDEGLCDDQVLAVLDDGAGRLWMSSSAGIFSVEKRELRELDHGSRDRIECALLSRGDGMESAQAAGGHQPSAWRTRDGRLWFATHKGLAVVDPAAVGATNTLPPPVLIETVESDGQSWPIAAAGRLPAGTRRLEIAYTGLSLAAPDKVRFRYRLVGFDADWIEAGTSRRASYTNLPPGDYAFEVIACNNDGLWNFVGARFDFSVAPFYYQTAWFYAGVVSLVAFAGLGLHTQRLKQLRLRTALLDQRARLSQEIHDNVSQIMTGVVLQLDAARQTIAQGPEACAPYIARAARLAGQGIEETRVLVRALRDGGPLPASPGVDLRQALLNSVAPLVQGTDVQLEVSQRGEPLAFAGDAEREIFHIGQEAVTNALRHGRARHIGIEVAFVTSGVRLTIEDDGEGFEPAAVMNPWARGFGLAGMARRVAEHRGRLDIDSAPGRGTTLTAFFPSDQGRE